MTGVRDTSVEAYKELRDSGELSDRQYNVLEWLSEYNESHEDSATARELHQWLAVDQANEKAQLGGPNFVKPRITELKEKGFIEEDEKRECSVTGRKAYELKVVARQETIVEDEDDFYVDDDGNRYIFNPNKDPGVGTESSSSEVLSSTPSPEDEKDEDDSQQVLFDGGVVS